MEDLKKITAKYDIKLAELIKEKLMEYASTHGGKMRVDEIQMFLGTFIEMMKIESNN